VTDLPVRLVPYDPAWPARFESLAGRIRSALGEGALLLEHAGSTAVPGLAAKPVIDIVLAVADSADEPSYVPVLERQGFVVTRREPAWYEHRLLKPAGSGAAVAANVHVFSAGCDEIDRMLAFRDRLRENVADRRLYEETKSRLAARPWKRVQDYADAKSDVVRGILARAAWEELLAYTLGHRDPAFIHQHVVDSFAAQEADGETKPIKLTFALVGLYLHLEKGFTGRQVQRAHMALARNRRGWPSFPLPAERGSITAAQVLAAPPGPERDAAIDAWCASVWEAYADSHEAVAELLRRHGIL
jgi:GrpB-like predicted nucleotidyltransferase (UPF0157 family)